MKAFQLVKFMKKVLANREVSIYVHGKPLNNIDEGAFTVLQSSGC